MPPSANLIGAPKAEEMVGTPWYVRLILENLYLSLSELGRGPQLSSCGHIFCNSCVLEFHESSGRCCGECGAKCELLPISPQMTK